MKQAWSFNHSNSLPNVARMWALWDMLYTFPIEKGKNSTPEM